MSFEADERFLRRFFRETHLKPVAANRWSLSDSLFKISSVQLDSERKCRASVDHECVENPLQAVRMRWRAEKPKCGIASLRHHQIDGAGATVELFPEFGNDFHCNLDWGLDHDQETLFKLARAAMVECWPTDLEATEAVQVIGYDPVT